MALEKQIAADPPVVIGGALIVPIGLLLGERTPIELIDTRITEQAAMQAVWETEIALGNQPRDVSMEKLGYDIESLDPAEGHMRFIEVKGRKPGAQTVTVTRGEVICCRNTPSQFILALVAVENGQAGKPRYVRAPFQDELGPDVATVVNLLSI